MLRGEIDRCWYSKRFVRRDGGIAYGQLHCAMVRTPDGSPVRLVAHFFDRSDQVKAEEEARQNQERLAHITRLTTIGEMAAGIAHEINQPLTSIATYAQASRRLIRSGHAASEQLLEVLEKVSAQAHRAGEVIQRLRLFIKRRQSRNELIDLNELVREAVELARADARFRDVPIREKLTPELPRVVVDAVQIQQVILNLLCNGIEACEAAGNSEPVSVSTARAGDEFLEVAVSDQGVGLTEDERDRLFEAFYTTKESGLGMGLTISRSIITSCGGQLWCDASPRGGATFRFTLPVALGEEAPLGAVDSTAQMTQTGS
jgi:two-component system sensor kinase FixL